PPYYPALLELVTRFVRSPRALMSVLRYAEWLTEATAARRAVPPTLAFREQYNVVAGKLLTDLCAFLVTAAELPHGFRDGVGELFERAPTMERSREEQATAASP